MKLNPRALLSAAALTLLGATCVQAQARKLYVTSSLGGEIIQNGGVVGRFKSKECTTALAVLTTIRAVACQYNQTGLEFSLSGASLGVVPSYTNRVDQRFWDGASDGIRNYAAGSFGNKVYAANADWSNPVPIFTTVGGLSGIAYDADHNSLWIGQGGQTVANAGPDMPTVFEYSMTGQLLSSFTADFFGEGASGIAYDDVDQTLWIVGYNAAPEIWHYARNGTRLGKVVVPGNGFFIGAEFQVDETVVTPEPTSFVLVAIGMLGLVVLARRKRPAYFTSRACS